MKLAKKMVLSLPRKNLVFNPRKGRIYSKRTNKLLVSVKDPFIKEINYGMQMHDREKFNHLISVLKSFIKAAANKSVDAFLLDPGDAPINASDTTVNNTTSLSNTGSPASSGGQEEENKVSVSKLNITAEEDSTEGLRAAPQWLIFTLL